MTKEDFIKLLTDAVAQENNEHTHTPTPVPKYTSVQELAKVVYEGLDAVVENSCKLKARVHELEVWKSKVDKAFDLILLTAAPMLLKTNPPPEIKSILEKIAGRAANKVPAEEMT